MDFLYELKKMLDKSAIISYNNTMNKPSFNSRNFLYYIVGLLRNSRLRTNFFKAGFDYYSSLAFLFVNKNTNIFYIKLYPKDRAFSFRS